MVAHRPQRCYQGYPAGHLEEIPDLGAPVLTSLAAGCGTAAWETACAGRVRWAGRIRVRHAGSWS